MKPSLFVFAFLLLFGTSCDRRQKKATHIAEGERLITTTLNTYVDSCWNKGDVSNLKDISTEGFIRNLNGITVANSQNEMQAHMTLFFMGFPDLEVRLDSTHIKDNAIFTHWTSAGTHTGMFGEIAATGKKVNISGFSQFYFDGEGKMYREDVIYNELQLLQQLGYSLIPPVLE